MIDTMADRKRVVGKDLTATWEQATGDSDPVAALIASRSLYHRLSNWQAILAAEALSAGATWEEIGEALGTTRQAAWARFKEAAEIGGKPMAEEAAPLRSEALLELKALQERLRSRDQELRQDKKRIQSQLETLRDQMRALDRQRSDDKRALQDEIRDKKRALRDRLRALRGERPASG
jgi:hypothetical protein